ncbi:MAG: ABC transporter permease [Chloroflexota bacterium]
MTLRRSLVPIFRSAGFILVSSAVVGAIYAFTGFSLSDVGYGVWEGALAAPGAIQATLRWSTPLVIVGAGVAVALRAGFFNVGAQGQFYVGATAGLAVALAAPQGPGVVIVPLACGAAVLAGAAWSLIPGLLRVRFGTDEVITTMMGNFIGSLWLAYVTAGPLRDVSGSGDTTASRIVNDAFRISDSAGVSPITLAAVIVVLVAIWVLLNRTGFGLTSGIAGRNPVMARWQGVHVNQVGLWSFAISGGLAGLAGAIEVFGPMGRLVSAFTPDLGFTAILVAIVGSLNPGGILATGLFFGGLQAALLYLPIVTPLPTAALQLLRGMIALLITAGTIPGLVLLARRFKAREIPRQL